uniref:Sugar transporter SWEET1 n=1 Tax=Panagrolaimus sp. JU765 TaxID=591449 RepID=A0AC34QJL7_9BILA
MLFIPHFVKDIVEKVADEPFNFMTVLSISAIITTVSLFFCGIPICVEIFRRRSTKEISGFPFIMGLLGGAYWLRYGFLKHDLTMITVNMVGVSLMFTYILFYIYFTKEKGSILVQFAIVLGLVLTMVFLVQIYGMDLINYLGFVCMSFNILNFGAPLAGVKVVLRKKSCDTLPLPLCTANLLVSSQWCLYGFLVDDIYIIIPNGCGVVLALLQLSLFLIFPRKLGGKAPLSFLFNSNSAIGKDIEKVKEFTKRQSHDKPNLPDAKYGLKPENWGNSGQFDKSISSFSVSQNSAVPMINRTDFDQSFNGSIGTTCTGVTWASASHNSNFLASANGKPALRADSSDSDSDEIDVDTPLHSPSQKKTFEFNADDGSKQSWVENEVPKTDSDQKHT